MHCHVLYGVDDGSDSIGTSLSMLKTARDEGVTHVILTPHYKSWKDNASIETLRARKNEIAQRAEEEGIFMHLALGHEIFYFDGMMDDLEAGKILTLAGTDHLLVEFHPMEDFRVIQNALYEIRANDLIPVLAHVERYDCIVRKFSYAEKLAEMGVKLQVNSGTVTKNPGFVTRQFLKKLFKEEMVEYISTDAHDTKNRAPRMRECRKILERKYDGAYVDRIMSKNGRKFF